MLKKHGLNFVKQRLHQKILRALVIMGFKQATGITGVINTIVQNIFQPGLAAARYLDRRDGKYDGYVSI